MTWPQSLKLLDLNGRDSFTLGHALYGGIVVIGGTGAGKTTGPYQNTVRSMMRQDFGGLFLCVKEDAAESYRRWAREEKREADVLDFGLGSGHAFNYLNWISTRHKDGRLVVEETVHGLTQLTDILERRRGRDDQFFTTAADQLYRTASEVLQKANGQIDLDSFAEMLSSMPRDPNQVRSKESFCGRMLEKAWLRTKGTDQEQEMRAVFRFLQVDWPNWAVDTRESIRASAQVPLDLLTHEPLVSLFGRRTTVTPEDVLNGKLLIVDIPIHVRERMGQIAATIWKTAVQQATLSRNNASKDEAEIRPIFIAGDEAPELVTNDDPKFVSSSRESRGITIYAAQTINHFVDVLGEPKTKAMLAGVRNRFICRTEDHDTAMWARDAVGESMNDGLNLGPRSWSAGESNAATTEVLRNLKQGGGKRKKVEAVVSLGNDTFKANGRRWYKATFPQNIPKPDERQKLFMQKYFTNDVIIPPKRNPAEKKEGKGKS
jgi:hypothetical protein